MQKIKAPSDLSDGAETMHQTYALFHTMNKWNLLQRSRDPEIPEINTKFISAQSPSPRWNFNKANWSSYSKEVDQNLRWIAPIRKNYKRLTGIVTAAAKRTIPRGFRKNYIPGWSNELESKYPRNCR